MDGDGLLLYFQRVRKAHLDDSEGPEHAEAGQYCNLKRLVLIDLMLKEHLWHSNDVTKTPGSPSDRHGSILHLGRSLVTLGLNLFDRTQTERGTSFLGREVDTRTHASGCYAFFLRRAH